MKLGYKICLVFLALLLTGCAKEKEPEPPVDSSQTQVVPVYEELSDEELEVYSIEGDEKAQMELANRYDFGSAEKGQNFEQAKKYYEMAAAQENKDALRCLGYIYLNGVLGEKDLDRAMEYFSQAIALEDTDAYVGVGRTYLAGYGDEETRHTQALENIRVAYQKGTPAGIYWFAYLLENKIGTVANEEKALELYEQVAQMEDLSVYDKYLVNAAKTRLGVMYTEAKGVAQDYDKAISYFKDSADDDYATAQYYLGQMYENGYGVDKNYEKAFAWYQKAAEQDYAPALNQMGYLYYKGNGVESSVEQAIYYHKLAAMQGYAAAQINLGYLYENGIGVEKNNATALEYYQMAAAQDNDGAKEAVARVQKKINEGK